jgi:hypothetical protein
MKESATSWDEVEVGAVVATGSSPDRFNSKGRKANRITPAVTKAQTQRPEGEDARRDFVSGSTMNGALTAVSIVSGSRGLISASRNLPYSRKRVSS